MDTITAISTAPGIGGIGIVRISGKETYQIIERIFVPKGKNSLENIKGYNIRYGNIINPKTNKIIDEVLVSFFREPKSYTTEDMCEINSHGGRIILQQILEIILENGAKLAKPGEFTKRAFLNGRIDLSQAESIIDIIHAKTNKESAASMNQLKGHLSQEINAIREKTLEIITDVEALIDYPEYDIEEVTNDKAMNVLLQIQRKLEKLEKSFDVGKIIKEGIISTIIGKPNSGKSSLLNAILKEERAIVTDIKGTTRDVIEEYIEVEGIPIKIIDTAGIRDSKDVVETIGIEKSREMADRADIVIAIFDSSSKLEKEDEEILNIIKDKKAILVLNKIDLNQNILKQEKKLLDSQKEIIEISALNKEGIDKVLNKIIEMFKANEIKLDGEVLITNVRHKNLISKAIISTKTAIEDIRKNMPLDIISINIKEILEKLGEITGENVSEDIINNIFKKFCLGK